MLSQENSGYIVVFEGVGGKKSNWKGVRTATSFASQEAFQQWENETSNGDIIIAAGVTIEVASKLTAQTTLLARQNALLKQIAANPAAARMYETNAAFALQHDIQVLGGFSPPYGNPDDFDE